MYKEVFSEYEAKQVGIIFSGDSVGETNKCLGALEETLNAKTVVKQCGGVNAKTRTKGAGTGELNLSIHMPYDTYVTIFGMSEEGLKSGVIAYGQNSLHKEFCLTVKVLDEDAIVKYKAYPRCIISNDMSRKIENGADEVAYIDLTIAIMPDEQDNCMYEAIESELTDDAIKTQWMTAFSYDLIKAGVA